MEKCNWCLSDDILQKYHDEEWGNPLHDDKKHFEYLLMEVMKLVNDVEKTRGLSK